MNLSYTRSAAKQLDRIPAGVRKRIFAATGALLKDPQMGKKLKGELSDYRSLRVGEYRVIYSLDVAKKQVIVESISPRGSAYQQ